MYWEVPLFFILILLGLFLFHSLVFIIVWTEAKPNTNKNKILVLTPPKSSKFTGIQSSTHGEYPSRRVKMSNQSTSNSEKTLKEVGHNSIMAPHSSPQGEYSKPSLGWIHHPGPPLQLWGGHGLGGPGPPNGSRSWGQFMVPWYPWVPSKFGPRGSISSWGPPITPTDCRTPKSKNGQIGPEFQQTLKMAMNGHRSRNSP